MRNPTRLIFNQYMHQIATLNGVTDITKSFSVQPSVQQTIETRMQEGSEFLTKINIVGGFLCAKNNGRHFLVNCIL